MNIIFIGIQGSGKGTQAKIISKKYNLCHISTGDLLRSLTGELKTEVDNIINKGNLIPDNLMIKILKERIKQDDCKNGIILDGFPRNLAQAKLLESILKIDKIVEIKITDEESQKRLLGRRTCPKCGIGYNIYTQPKPKRDGICDICSSKLEQRKDDNEDSIKKRINIYHNDTEPIIEFYNDKLISVDGSKDIDTVSQQIIKQIN